jgi:hypothetical protein
MQIITVSTKIVLFTIFIVLPPLRLFPFTAVAEKRNPAILVNRLLNTLKLTPLYVK